MICSDCFIDEGLRLMAESIGFMCTEPCKNCKSIKGKKLDKVSLLYLADRFYRAGTMHRSDYGAAPVINFNEYQETSVVFDNVLEEDTKLISEKTGVGFFLYGPRLWLLGYTEPLEALQDENKVDSVLDSIIRKYPEVVYDETTKFYRVRKNPSEPKQVSQYDSPPVSKGEGRLDSVELPVMYASFDLEVCIHECRITAEDELYLATLKPFRPLKFLDFSIILKENNVTEFTSIDIAVFMLFMAKSNSYGILRKLSQKVFDKGYDGLIYPSYFSMLHSGAEPFDTTFGISHRMFDQYRDYEESKLQKNIAIFGWPVRDGKVKVDRINKMYIRQVKYTTEFGPVDYQ